MGSPGVVCGVKNKYEKEYGKEGQTTPLRQ